MKNIIKIDSSLAAQNEKIIKTFAKSFEPYEKISSSLSSRMNEISKIYLASSQIRLDGVSKLLKETMDVYTKTNMAYLTSGLFSDSMRSTMEKLASTFKLYEQVALSDSVKELLESMSVVSKSFSSEQMRQLQQIDFSALFADVLPKASSFSDIVETAYTLVQDECDENDSFTEAEVQEALNEQVTNSEGFQARVAGWSEKKKVQFFIVWQLICFIYGNFFQPYFQEKIGMPVTAYVVSNVKELPEKGAKIVGQIQENIEAIITENTNYYYKVIFTDENGETKEGYVAKRNLKVIEDQVEESATEESTSVSE